MLILEIKQKNRRLITEQWNDPRWLLIERKHIVPFVTSIEQYITEAELTPDQIKNLFTDTEAGAIAAGRNRTSIGKAVDVSKLPAKAVQYINQQINKLGRAIQNSGPVKNIDDKFDQLKAKLDQNDSKVAQGIKAVSDWAKENPGKASLAVGILTTAAAMAGGPMGGAVAGFLARATKDLLQGEKLSTAAGKSIKTAIVGFITGKAFDFLSGEIKNWFSNMKADEIAEAGAALNKAKFDEIVGNARAKYGDAAELYAKTFPDGVSKLDINDVVSVQGQTQVFKASNLFLTSEQKATFNELRYNIKVDPFIKALDAQGLPAASLPNPEYFKEIGKAFEYLRNIQNNTDQESMLRIVSAGEKAIDALSNASKEFRNNPELKAQLAKLSGDAAKDISIINNIAKLASAAGQGAVTGAMSNAKKASSKESKQFTELQIKTLIEWCNEPPSSLTEGPLDALKKGAEVAGGAIKKGAAAVGGAIGKSASAVAGKTAQIGKNITTKVTADKLMSAWKKAGSPTDSDKVAQVMRNAGVSDDVMEPAFKSMNIPFNRAQQNKQQPTNNQQKTTGPSGNTTTTQQNKQQPTNNQQKTTTTPTIKPGTKGSVNKQQFSWDGKNWLDSKGTPVAGLMKQELMKQYGLDASGNPIKPGLTQKARDWMSGKTAGHGQATRSDPKASIGKKLAGTLGSMIGGALSGGKPDTQAPTAATEPAAAQPATATEPAATQPATAPKPQGQFKQSHVPGSKGHTQDDPYELGKQELRKLQTPDANKKQLPGGKLPAKAGAEVTAMLNRLSKGDKDAGAIAAKQILQYAKAGYDVSNAANVFLANAKQGERFLSTESYQYFTQMLESFGLTWADIGLTVRIDEAVSAGVFIIRSDLHRLKELAGVAA